MDTALTVSLTTREALAIIGALMDLGLNRQHGRPHLESAELALTRAIFNASSSNVAGDPATRSQSSYEAD